jgi:hypothetical protein
MRFRNRTALKAGLLLCFCVFGLRTALSQSTPEGRENIIIRLPGLKAWQATHATWFVSRHGGLWIQSEFHDLSKLIWPQWDIKQNPVALIPSESLPNAEIVIYDDNGSELDREAFKGPWVPEKILPTLKGPPSSFQIEVALSPHLTLKTRRYAWPERKPAFKCHAEVAPDVKAIDKDKRIAFCLRTLHGLTTNESKQWFVDVQWPRLSDRESLSYLTRQDRELRVAFRKKNHLYSSRRVKTPTFDVVAGLTKVEDLPTIAFSLELLPETEKAQKAPEPGTKPVPILESVSPDGEAIIAYSLPSDVISEQSLLSPEGMHPSVFLQLIPNSDDGQVQTQKTEFPEYRTGVLGYLRPWAVQGGVLYDNLVSNRKEVANLASLGVLDARYRYALSASTPWSLVPRLLFENDLLRAGSSLSVTELQVGTFVAWNAKQALMPYLGYLGYSLSGRNPGSSRLGSFSALSWGLEYSNMKRPYLVKAYVANLVTLGGEGFDLGLDANLQLSRFMGSEGTHGAYVGAYMGYAIYRVKLPNRIGEIENFGENRFRIGLVLGWMGADFF